MSLSERPRTGERAVLVHLALGNGKEDDCAIAEFRELAASAGAVCVGLVTGSRRCPDAHYFVGSGKAGEIRQAVLESGAEVVIVNHDISPGQERNLETFLQCRVVDRSGLILDIFAQRARSFEGKLQVELAQLRHLSTRLVRGWTHLERQKGGIGLRGPGETQLETDRRLLAERIKQINRRLQKVEQRRQQGRQSRYKADIPTVSLVGYTNAGKSTLFNCLTAAGVYVAEQLFATLDTTLRRLALPNRGPVVVADTVGFISHLPHELVAAFRSTLQETCEASLLLHVIDASDPGHRDYADQVEQVLASIGADRIPRVAVFNKIDRVAETPRLERDTQGQSRAVWVSAASGAGLELLLAAIAERLSGDTVHGWVHLPPEASRLRARLFSLGAVLKEQLSPAGEWLIEVQTSRKNWQQLCHKEGFREEWMQAVS
jgi:GTP-binding protein HflX